MYGALKCYNIRHEGSRQNTRHMKKKLITQSDDLIAQGVADKLIRIDAFGKPTKVNELDEIGAELAKFISKERGDE